jgi:hypothetical protein
MGRTFVLESCLRVASEIKGSVVSVVDIVDIRGIDDIARSDEVGVMYVLQNRPIASVANRSHRTSVVVGWLVWQGEKLSITHSVREQATLWSVVDRSPNKA